MLKTKLFSKFNLVVVALAFSANIACADDAPVVDITESNQAMEQNQGPSMSGSAQTFPDPGVANTSNSDYASTSGTTNYRTPPPPPSYKHLTSEQRLSRLESQMDNLVQMNLPQQITEMQQTLQKLQGQLQQQSHDLKSLAEQQKSFYQDMDHRIGQLKGNTTTQVENKPAVDNAQAQMGDANAYQESFRLLSKKQYDKAKQSFQNYLNNYPKGKFLANAHYWLGEINLLQKNNLQSEKEFMTIVRDFPNSTRVADAKLKLAIIHINQGKSSQARQELQKVKSQYPGSTASQLASIQLQQLSIGGN